MNYILYYTGHNKIFVKKLQGKLLSIRKVLATFLLKQFQAKEEVKFKMS